MHSGFHPRGRSTFEWGPATCCLWERRPCSLPTDCRQGRGPAAPLSPADLSPSGERGVRRLSFPGASLSTAASGAREVFHFATSVQLGRAPALELSSAPAQSARLQPGRTREGPAAALGRACPRGAGGVWGHPALGSSSVLTPTGPARPLPTPGFPPRQVEIRPATIIDIRELPRAHSLFCFLDFVPCIEK